MGLPGVDRVVGQRPDGTAALEYRPISHNELSTARARREYSKSHGLEPVERSVKKAVGR